MKIVTYRYALDGDSLICIDSFIGSSSERKIYKCPACQQDSIPVMGKKKQWHFRHRGYDLSVKSESIQCPYDTYLRTISRTLFDQSYKDAITDQQPVILEYSELGICNCEYTKCETKSLKEYDLIQKFRPILKPPQNRKKYPDLYLIDDKGIKIHILMLTQKEQVSSDLIKSKDRIISFRIPNEISLSRFDPIGKISDTDEGTKYFNFNTTETVNLKPSCDRYPQLKKNHERKIKAEEERFERERQANKERLKRKLQKDAEEKEREYYKNYPTSSFEKKYLGPATVLEEGYYFSVDFSGKCDFVRINDLDCFFGQIPDGYSYFKHYNFLNNFKPHVKDYKDCFYDLTTFVKDKSPIKIVDCYLCEDCELNFNGNIDCPQGTGDHLRALTCRRFKLWFDRFL